MPLIPDYVPIDWVDTVTPVDEARMDHIEGGVDRATDGVNALDTRVTTLEGRPVTPAVQNGKWIKGVGGAMVWSDIAISDVANLQTTLNGKQDTSAKGAVNGYASLDSGGKVPAAQLPVSIDLRWAGAYAAATAYKEGDVVTYNGISYMALRPSTGETPAPWSTGASSMETQVARLMTDFTIASTNTWTDGHSISLGAGTWLILAQVLFQQGAGGAGTVTLRLWDGTNVLAANDQGSLTASVYGFWTASAVATFAATTSVRLACYNSRANGKFLANNVAQPQGAGFSTFINALKVAS
jgi:hypothetical protein